MLTAEHTEQKLSLNFTDHDENWLDNANNVAFNSLSNELRKDGFINQRVIQTLARGSHDHEVENWVCGLYDFDPYNDWTLTQRHGSKQTPCDIVAECARYGKLRVEVKAAKERKDMGYFFQGCSASKFDIIHFVFLGRKGWDIEMMTSEEFQYYFDPDGKDNQCPILRHNECSDWVPRSKAYGLVREPNLRSKEFVGEEYNPMLNCRSPHIFSHNLKSLPCLS